MIKKQRFSRRVVILGVGILATLIAAPLLLIQTRHQGPQFERLRIGGINWTYVLSFADLETATPFVAVVRSKAKGTTNLGPNKLNGTAVPARQSKDYISVELLKTDGTTLEIYQQDPSPKAIAFFSSLRIGMRYEFASAYAMPKR